MSRAVVLEVVEPSFANVAAFLRGFNAVSLDEDGQLWVALTRDVPRIGQEVNLVRARLESETG